jgi:hypothetical protein
MATGWTFGIRFQEGAMIFLHTASRPTLEAHSVSYTVGTGSKEARGIKLSTHEYLVLRLRMVDLYLHSPILLNVVMLN